MFYTANTYPPSQRLCGVGRRHFPVMDLSPDCVATVYPLKVLKQKKGYGWYGSAEYGTYIERFYDYSTEGRQALLLLLGFRNFLHVCNAAWKLRKAK